MDGKTTEIRYQQWVQVIQNCSGSGLSKREYCRANGIDEKQFYYYQRRVRSLIAERAERQLLPDDNSSMASVSRAAGSPQIVKLQLPVQASNNSTMISFSVNSINLSVPENIPASFLAKLLEAAHDSD